MGMPSRTSSVAFSSARSRKRIRPSWITSSSDCQSVILLGECLTRHASRVTRAESNSLILPHGHVSRLMWGRSRLATSIICGLHGTGFRSGSRLSTNRLSNLKRSIPAYPHLSSSHRTPPEYQPHLAAVAHNGLVGAARIGGKRDLGLRFCDRRTLNDLPKRRYSEHQTLVRCPST